MEHLLWRAVVAFLALPGTVAFLVPLLLLRPAVPWRAFHVLGLIPLVSGAALLLWCVKAFYTAGQGTLAPWSPPRHLVTSGSYGVSRNPMYIAVLLVLAGWAAGFGSPGLALYAVTVALAFQVRIVLGEEPWLARTHGEAWTRYSSRVPRWLGIRRKAS